MPTTTAVAASPNPATVGQAVTLSASVVRSSSGTTPTGTVIFTVDGQARTPVGVAPTGSNFVATLNVAGLAVGTHTITAACSGDSTFALSTSSSFVEAVNPAPLTASTMALRASPSPSPVGQAVTFPAAVASRVPGAGTPTGTVTFREGTTVLQSVPLDSAGRAASTTSALGIGPHTITAVYSGDATFTTSSGTTIQTVQAASLIPTTTTALTSPNPSTVGQLVLLSATVPQAPGSSGTPTGTVTFMDGTTALGAAPLDANGRVSLATLALGVGPHTIAAVYGGDAAFAASAGTTVETVTAAAGKAPGVAKLQRFGFHQRPTALVLTFDRPLDPATARNPRNYRIVGPGGHPIGLGSATYDPATQAVTLLPSRRLNIHHLYRFTVIGTGPSGLKGADGKPLDGAGTGRPGTDYTAVIDRSTLVLPLTQTRSAAHPHVPSPARHHT